MVNQATISRTFCSSHAPNVTNRSSKIKKRFLTPFPRQHPRPHRSTVAGPQPYKSGVVTNVLSPRTRNQRRCCRHKKFVRATKIVNAPKPLNNPHRVAPLQSPTPFLKLQAFCPSSPINALRPIPQKTQPQPRPKTPNHQKTEFENLFSNRLLTKNKTVADTFSLSSIPNGFYPGAP
jgi:hypothetical protein